MWRCSTAISIPPRAARRDGTRGEPRPSRSPATCSIARRSSAPRRRSNGTSRAWTPRERGRRQPPRGHDRAGPRLLRPAARGAALGLRPEPARHGAPVPGVWPRHGPAGRRGGAQHRVDGRVPAVDAHPAYAAAKAAVSNFTQWLAVHLAQEYSPRIRVNAVAPGFFLTRQNRFLLTDLATGDLTARGRSIIAHTPMARFGTPEDLLGPVLWLLSPASAFRDRRRRADRRRVLRVRRRLTGGRGGGRAAMDGPMLTTTGACSGAGYADRYLTGNEVADIVATALASLPLDGSGCCSWFPTARGPCRCHSWCGCLPSHWAPGLRRSTTSSRSGRTSR